MLTWRLFFVLLFGYRCVMAVVAETWVKGLTDSLGDAYRYQTKDVVEGFWSDSTNMTAAIGTGIRSIVGSNPILIDIGFQTIAYVGILRFLLALTPRERGPLAFLVLMPSFTLWSSIAGKEAIMVFATGYLAGFIIDLYHGRVRADPIVVLATYLVLVFKIHYLPAILFIVGVTITVRQVQQKATAALIFGFISLFFLYSFADYIDRLSFEVLNHFWLGPEGGRATRPPFFVEQYDVFSRAPLGMFLGFFGPTLDEAMDQPIRAMAFVESAIILVVLGFLLIRQLPSLPVYNLIIIAFTLFWILFATYPVAIMNPGSAVRYRTGYELLVFMLFGFLTTRESYLNWVWSRLHRAQRRVQPARAPKFA